MEGYIQSREKVIDYFEQTIKSYLENIPPSLKKEEIVKEWSYQEQKLEYKLYDRLNYFFQGAIIFYMKAVCLKNIEIK